MLLFHYRSIFPGLGILHVATQAAPGLVFCIKNDLFCIKNDVFCIKNDELCIENDELWLRDRRNFTENYDVLSQKMVTFN